MVALFAGLAVALVIPAVPAFVAAQDTGGAVSARPFVPNLRPQLSVSTRSGEILIDGIVDDAAWGIATRATSFSETFPGDLTRPPVDTEVFITYDDANLYVAFIAHDPRPAEIRASLRARDEINDDDHVGIIIDTYGTAAWAYELYANPYGIQGDNRWTREESDEGFDIVFTSRGQITERGYEVEMAIPFKSLRFPTVHDQSWRITFTRIHPRDSQREYQWAAISRDDPCYPCQFGTMTGISGVRSGGLLEFLPAVVGKSASELSDPADPNSGFEKSDSDLEVSLGALYAFTPSTSAELSINPDFSQVESDVAQIDVNTTFALFFPERRPFFMEGGDLYTSWYNLIYTRQINDPSVAAKLTSRSGGSALVYLFGRDDETPYILPFEERSAFAAPGKSYSNIFRARQNFREDSYIGGTLTDRRYDIGGGGSVASVDGTLRFANNYRIEGQVVGSYTHEPDDTTLTPDIPTDATFDGGKHTAVLDGESYTGGALYLSLERDARHWSSDIDWWESTPTFRADNGFVVRNSESRVSWYNHYMFYFDDSVFERVRPTVGVWRRWNAAGSRKGQALEGVVNFVLKGQTTVGIGYDLMDERFRGTYFSDIGLAYVELETAKWENLLLGFWFGWGDRLARTADPAPFLGTGEALDIWGTIKFSNRFVLEPLLVYSALRYPDTNEEFFRGWIGRLKFNFQFTRELFLRFVVQYDDFDGLAALEPLLSYEHNPFTVFYIGGNVLQQDFDHKSFDPVDRTGDGFQPAQYQFFFKFQYFFRL